MVEQHTDVSYLISTVTRGKYKIIALKISSSIGEIIKISHKKSLNEMGNISTTLQIPQRTKSSCTLWSNTDAYHSIKS